MRDRFKLRACDAHLCDKLPAQREAGGRRLEGNGRPRDVWTPIAGPPVAFEPPSAGFALSWQLVTEMRVAGAQFKTITHAAGLSSTGDPELDKRLPFDEPYRVPRDRKSVV